jgi:hypothetical protein
LNVHAGLARFPDDGLTLDALVSKADIRALEGPSTRRPANGNGNGRVSPRPEVSAAATHEEKVGP